MYLTRVHKELSEHILFMVHLKCNQKVQETILRTFLHEMFQGKLCPERRDCAHFDQFLISFSISLTQGHLNFAEQSLLLYKFLISYLDSNNFNISIATAHNTVPTYPAWPQLGPAP